MPDDCHGIGPPSVKDREKQTQTYDVMNRVWLICNYTLKGVLDAKVLF